MQHTKSAKWELYTISPESHDECRVFHIGDASTGLDGFAAGRSVFHYGYLMVSPIFRPSYQVGYISQISINIPYFSQLNHMSFYS
jgi:hypothetical protein